MNIKYFDIPARGYLLPDNRQRLAAIMPLADTLPVGETPPPTCDYSWLACTHTDNQGKNPWCGAYDGVEMIQVIYTWKGHTPPDSWGDGMSEMLYNAAKVVDGEPGKQNGTSHTSVIEGMINLGWLYPEAKADFYASPDDRLKWGLIRRGYVMLGANITDGWGALENGDTITSGRRKLGGHSIGVVGYDDFRGAWLILNWWNVWGFKKQIRSGWRYGFAWYPYEIAKKEFMTANSLYS